LKYLLQMVMKKIAVLLFGFLLGINIFGQADEIPTTDDRTYPVILIKQKGEVKNVFMEGKGITVKINGKNVTGDWYFKAEPDVVTIVGKKGNVLGHVRLNEQKTITLETDEVKNTNGGMSIGIGLGPVGLSTGGNTLGPRYISYNMTKNKAVFDQQKETREDKIRREYAEKKRLEELRKEQEKQERKQRKRK